jgi:hypothetical protein
MKATIICNQVFEKKPTKVYENGFKVITSSDGFMRIHHYHQYGDLFFFANYILAEDLNTLFVLNMYGYNVNHYDEREFDHIEELLDNAHMISEIELCDILMSAFPGVIFVDFGYEVFENTKRSYQDEIVALPWMSQNAAYVDLKRRFSVDTSDAGRTFSQWFENIKDIDLIIEIVTSDQVGRQY